MGKNCNLLLKEAVIPEFFRLTGEKISGIFQYYVYGEEDPGYLPRFARQIPG